MNDISSFAMLATLSISQWTARKYDKSVSTEVEKAHQASDAGRYNKLLVDKASLEPMEKIAGAARQYHYKVTLPWGDNGDRLLPSTLFMDFTDTMRKYRNEFEARVQEFVIAYPGLVQAARKRLSTMYNAQDYPADIRGRYEFSLSFTPVATADDFRVKLSTEHLDHVKRDITAQIEDRQAKAVRNVWERAREIVSKIHQQTADEDRRIYDSSIENARDFVKLLPALNLTQDPELDRIAQDISALLVPTDRLRQDKTLRADTAKAASNILAKLPWA